MIQAIENWIDAIESSKRTEAVKEQEIKEIVDLWKFADSYDGEAIISQKGELIIRSAEGTEKINVLCGDLQLTQKKNAISKILSEIEIELTTLGSRYIGLYNVEFRKPNAHFDAEEIQNLKSEIISGIKGEVILYKYVERIRKLPSSELKIFNYDFKILECNCNDIETMIAKSHLPRLTDNKQWLVLVLSSVDQECKSFLIEETIKNKSFPSDFDKIFVFDFYTSEIIELNVTINIPIYMNGVATHQKTHS